MITPAPMTTLPSSASGRTAVFTIVSRNYLHFARVLMRSLERACPSYDRFVLLADEAGDAAEASQEPFTTVALDTLPLPEPAKFTFRYTILELNTAVKPWFFRALFAKGFARVIYLDPDIYMYRAMTEVDRALDAGALAVLVPHLTGRLDDGLHPDEQDILKSGVYNLGFCALARHAALDRLLDFWCEKSVDQFVADVERGLFTDQRWMDLVPGMFPDVSILRHEGYDVAYWNLLHRRLEARDGQTWVNDVPLVFFHFSGFDPLKPEAFSKHQNRYRTATAGLAGTLASDYAASLRAEGAEACARLPYAYGSLRDGSPLPDAFRRLYRTTPDVESWAGDDPFARPCGDWNAPIDQSEPPLTRAMLAVYRERVDLRVLWPDVVSRDRVEFARWFLDSPEVETVLPRCYVEPVRAMARRPAEPPAGLAPRVPPAVPFTPSLIAGAIRKASAAAAERRLPLSPARWWQLYRLHVREHAQDALRRDAPPLPPIDWSAFAEDDSGVSVVGYMTDGTGVSAGAHASALACDAAGIPRDLIDARPLKPLRGRRDVNLLHVNADQTPAIAELLGPDFFRDRYTIGFWAWELEHLPAAYDEAYAYVDEIWAPSTFVQAAVAARSPAPVIHMPHAVTVAPAVGRGRLHFGLPSDRFLFLVAYDTLSVQERKNPLAALDAFRRAFPDGQGAGIAVRVNHANQRPDDVAAVRASVASTRGAYLIEGPMERGDVLALQQACDCLVSLHRSEGFGLNIAEAMLLGKPVIVTAWSGNMDFTNQMNSCLVDAPLVDLDRDHGPYRRGSRWADPDVGQASVWMRRLFEHSDLGGTIGARARSTIAAELSPAAVGQRYRERLATIRGIRSLGRAGQERTSPAPVRPRAPSISE